MGLIQYIRLKLDQAGLEEIQAQAAQQSVLVAETLTKELGAGKAADKALLKYIQKLRQNFQEGTKGLREDLAKGLLDQKTAESSAGALAKTFVDTLKTKLASEAAKTLTGATKKRILEAVTPTAADLNMGGSGTSALGLSALARGLFTTTGPVSPQQQRALFQQAAGNIQLYNQLLGQAATQTTALGRVSQTVWGGISSGLKSVAGQMLGVISAYKAFYFLVNSVKVEAAQEAVWARLSTALADFKVKATDAWPEIKQVVDQFAALGYRGPVVAEVLTQLITTTGDYKKSLQAVGPTIDLAVERHLTFEQAAKIVGRAMIGNTGYLGRYGIVLDKTRDSITQLAERFGGSAAARSNTLQGALDRVSVAWFNVQTATGQALARAGSANQVYEHTITLLQNLRHEIEQDPDGIEALVRIANLLIFALTGVVRLLGEMNRELKSLKNNVKDAWQFLTNPSGWGAAVAARGSLDPSAPGAVTAAGSPLTSMPLGTGRGIKYHEDEDIQSNIAKLGRVATADDVERREEAMRALNKLYEEQSARLAEMDKLDGNRVNVENHLATIEKIRDAVEKQRMAAEKKERAERANDQRIELLKKVALLDQDQLRLQALQELNKLELQLAMKRDKQIAGGEYWFKLNEQILSIEEVKTEVADRTNKKRDQEIAQLTKQVQLQIDVKQAVERLSELEAQITQDADKQNLTLAQRFRYAEQLLAIQGAMTSKDDRQNDEITRLLELVQVTGKRAEAERGLQAMHQAITTELAKQNMTIERQVALRQQLARVDEALADKLNLPELTKSINAIQTLIKGGTTKAEGLALIASTVEKIQTALAKGNLSDADVGRLNAMLERLRLLQRKADEPSLDIFQDLKDTLKTDLPMLAQSAAKTMTDAFDKSFAAIFSSSQKFSKNVLGALAAIPKGMLAALTGALAQIAQKKITENLAYAIEEGAKGFGFIASGNEVAAGAAFKSASGHLLAATEWALLGGAAAAATGGLGSGGSGGGGGSSGSQATSTQPSGPSVVIYVDGIDPNNPRHQQLVRNTVRQAQERYGPTIAINPNG